MTEAPLEDIRLFELVRAVDAQYCENYSQMILKRLDAKDVEMSDEKWRELADCIHRARCMLEHAYCRVLPKAEPKETEEPNKIKEND